MLCAYACLQVRQCNVHAQLLRGSSLHRSGDDNANFLAEAESLGGSIFNAPARVGQLVGKPCGLLLLEFVLWKGCAMPRHHP